MKISPALSSYLDGVRFVAALAVLFGHLSQDGFAMDWMPLAKFSHSVVILFFVLSGFTVCLFRLAGFSFALYLFHWPINLILSKRADPTASFRRPVAPNCFLHSADSAAG